MIKRPSLCVALLCAKVMERIFHVTKTNVDSYEKISQASLEREGHQYNAARSFL